MRFLPFLFLLSFPVFGSADPNIPSEGPSFDCSLAHEPEERMICDSPYISAYDLHLSRLFAGLTPNDRARILPLQRNWINRRNSCVLFASDNSESTAQADLAKARQCMEHAYQDQIFILSQIIEEGLQINPITGRYGFESEAYPSNYGYQTTSSWSMAITVSASEPDLYRISIDAGVGPTHHICHLDVEASRQENSLFFDYDVFANGNYKQRQGILRYDPQSLSFEFENFDSRVYCGARAHLEYTTYFLER